MRINAISKVLTPFFFFFVICILVAVASKQTRISRELIYIDMSTFCQSRFHNQEEIVMSDEIQSITNQVTGRVAIYAMLGILDIQGTGIFQGY